MVNENLKVCILQTDNRPWLPYLLKTQEINKKFCEMLGYHYLYLELDNNKYGDIHPATKKIYVINDFLQNTEFDILVFLDSDAWVQNGYGLETIIQNLINNQEKHGCFSRDPYLRKNTFINSGSFIIKINDFVKQMYKTIINDLHNYNNYHNAWPFDQYYISKYVFENKHHFFIFIPYILNTPIGKVLRHNWFKTQQMYDDLHKLLHSDSDLDNFVIKNDYYDEADFPNTQENGYEYCN